MGGGAGINGTFSGQASEGKQARTVNINNVQKKTAILS